MFKNFLIKKMLKSRLGNVSDGQIDQIAAVIERNPEFFEMIAREIKQRIDTGAQEQDAALAVMQEHRAELEQILKK